MNYEGLYDVSYRMVDGKAVIYLFMRDKKGVKKIEKITGVLPYVYINEDVLAKKKSYDIIKVDDKVYKTVLGASAKKCYIPTPNKSYPIKEYYRNTTNSNCYSDIHEADLLFDLRYAIDHVDKVEQTKPKIVTLDIETDCLHGFPDKDKPIEPIICLSVLDNYSNKNITFAWRKDLKKKQDGDIFYFSTEVEMFTAFLEYWRSLDGDIVTGWNINFDINYLVARLLKTKLRYKHLSTVKDKLDYNDAVQLRFKGEVDILGMVTFDMLRAYRKMHFGELTSYSLNNVALEELGEEKDKVHNTGEVWRKNIKELIAYNRKDVVLVSKINDKCKLFSIFDDIKNYSGVRNVNDCFYASRIHETRLMIKHKDNLVFPTKPPFQEKSEKTMIQGALVREPTPGLYENIVCVDMKSLYPSIIYTFNLSKEMINDKGVEINGVKILQKPKGIMPSMIKELVELKDTMKEKVKGTGQDLSDKMFAIKTFINSFYGINALTSFRLYDKRIAENITYLGREVSMKCGDLIEKVFKYKIIYGDTDSLFIQVADGVDLIKEGNKIQDFINKKLPEIVKELGAEKSTLTIEFEKVYKRIIFQAKGKTQVGAKKRYAGLITYDDGKVTDKIKIAGMAARRSDTPAISKEMQTKLFDIILRGGTKEECVAYVKELISNMITEKKTMEEIALPVKLNKAPEEYKRKDPKLRGVEWSNAHIDTQFRSGTKFKMVYVTHDETDVICFEEEEQLKGITIDWTKMIEKCVYQKIKQLFETLNWQAEYEDIELYTTTKLAEEQS